MLAHLKLKSHKEKSRGRINHCISKIIQCSLLVTVNMQNTNPALYFCETALFLTQINNPASTALHSALPTGRKIPGVLYWTWTSQQAAFFVRSHPSSPLPLHLPLSPSLSAFPVILMPPPYFSSLPESTACIRTV